MIHLNEYINENIEADNDIVRIDESRISDFFNKITDIVQKYWKAGAFAVLTYAAYKLSEIIVITTKGVNIKEKIGGDETLLVICSYCFFMGIFIKLICNVLEIDINGIVNKFKSKVLIKLCDTCKNAVSTRNEDNKDIVESLNTPIQAAVACLYSYVLIKTDDEYESYRTDDVYSKINEILNKCIAKIKNVSNLDDSVKKYINKGIEKCIEIINSDNDNDESSIKVIQNNIEIFKGENDNIDSDVKKLMNEYEKIVNNNKQQ